MAMAEREDSRWLTPIKVVLPSGRIGVVLNERDGKLDVQYLDEEGGSVWVNKNLVKECPS